MRPESVLGAAGRIAWLAAGRRRRRVERLVGSRGLTVLARRSLFPAAGGFELTLALPDDPDTVAVLRVEDGADVAAALDDAVRAARVHGDELRGLLAAFAAVPVVGLYPHRDSPWVVAPLTDTTRAELAACVRAWAASRSPGALGDRVTVHVVEPGTEPPPDPRRPALFELTGRRRAAALRAATSHRLVLGTTR